MSWNWLGLKGQVGKRLPDAHGCLMMACHYPREGAEPQPRGLEESYPTGLTVLLCL